MPDTPLILASGSVIRRKMLEDAGIPCTIIKPAVDEDALKPALAHLPPEKQALALARAKAESVSRAHPGQLVLGADQVCALESLILSKPLTHANAVRQLQSMQGRTHCQHSAAALYRGGEELWSTVEPARLSMRALSDAEIEDYLRQDEPYHACGSYHYESGGKHLFSHVEGGEDVIQGLPLAALLRFLSCHPEA